MILPTTYASVVDTILFAALHSTVSMRSRDDNRPGGSPSYSDANLHLEPLLHGGHALEVRNAGADVLIDRLL